MPPTLADCYDAFLADAAHLARLRPRTVRAYRYELAAAAADPRFAAPLDALHLTDLEAWLARPLAAPRTSGRRAATFARFFAWAIRHGHCARNPLAGRVPTRTRRGLPRPIRDVRERDALAAAIVAAPPPYRLICTILRETGMRVGEVLARFEEVAPFVGPRHDAIAAADPAAADRARRHAAGLQEPGGVPGDQRAPRVRRRVVGAIPHLRHNASPHEGTPLRAVAVAGKSPRPHEV